MCLFRVHEEPDIVLPYKTVHHHHSSSHRRHSSRPSHVHIIDERRHSHIPIPPPAPVPAVVTISPPSPPPLPSAHLHHHSHSHGPQIVEVIPGPMGRSASRGSSSSSSSSSSEGSYIYRREVLRESALDPPPRRGFETYQYVTPPGGYQHQDIRYSGGRSRSRSRSQSRNRYSHMPDGRVKSTRIVLEDERPRRRKYHH